MIQNERPQQNNTTGLESYASPPSSLSTESTSHIRSYPYDKCSYMPSYSQQDGIAPTASDHLPNLPSSPVPVPTPFSLPSFSHQKSENSVFVPLGGGILKNPLLRSKYHLLTGLSLRLLQTKSFAIPIPCSPPTLGLRASRSPRPKDSSRRAPQRKSTVPSPCSDGRTANLSR